MKDGLIHDAEILHSVLDVHRDEIAAVICASVVKNACAMPAPRCLQVTARRMHQTQACLTAAADAPSTIAVEYDCTASGVRFRIQQAPVIRLSVKSQVLSLCRERCR